MATISGKELRSLYEQLAAQGYNYADIVALAKQFDVTEQELNAALKDPNAQIGYEAPEDKEKEAFENIRKDVESKQTEKKIGADELKRLVGDVQKAGYSMDDIYNLASQYDVSKQEIDAVLGGGKDAIGYRDPTIQELAQFQAIREANPTASKAADVIYSKNQTRSELEKLLPDRKITDSDVDYWYNQGGVGAVQKQFTKPAGQAQDSGGLGVKRVGMGDRSATGVDVAGETGIREAYVPLIEQLLENASAQANIEYQPYKGISPLVESAQSGISNLKTPGQFLQGSNLATAAGIGALGYGQYKPTQFTTGTFANPMQGTRGDIINFAEKYAGTPASAQQVGALDAYLKANPNTNFQSGVNTLLNIPPTGKAYGGEIEGYQAGGDVTEPINVGGTNPNLQPIDYGGQNVTNVQASYMSPYMQGVVDPALREAKRQSEIQGLTNAARFTQAGAFGGTRNVLADAERQRNLATQLGDIQGRGLQEAYTQGLGQFNAEQNRGLEAQKLGEQSRQFGAELGLKGLQTGIQAGQALGQLGYQQNASDLARLQQLYNMGTGERTFDYNEYLRGEQYPWQQLLNLKNIMGAVPAAALSPAAEVGNAVPGGTADAFNTFFKTLNAFDAFGNPVPKAQGGMISGIATLGE